MARQKSEDRDKPQGRRKPAVTREDEPRAGGEAIPVNEAPKQLLLFRWNKPSRSHERVDAAKRIAPESGLRRSRRRSQWPKGRRQRPRRWTR